MMVEQVCCLTSWTKTSLVLPFCTHFKGSLLTHSPCTSTKRKLNYVSPQNVPSDEKRGEIAVFVRHNKSIVQFETPLPRSKEQLD